MQVTGYVVAQSEKRKRTEIVVEDVGKRITCTLWRETEEEQGRVISIITGFRHRALLSAVKRNEAEKQRLDKSFQAMHELISVS